MVGRVGIQDQVGWDCGRRHGQRHGLSAARSIHSHRHSGAEHDHRPGHWSAHGPGDQHRHGRGPSNSGRRGRHSIGPGPGQRHRPAAGHWRNGHPPGSQRRHRHGDAGAGGRHSRQHQRHLAKSNDHRYRRRWRRRWRRCADDQPAKPICGNHFGTVARGHQ